MNANNIASNLRIRYSEDYMSDQQIQDFLEGTENLSFDRYLVGLSYGTNEIKEFRFSDNSSVKVPTTWGDSNFRDYNITPADATVRTANIMYKDGGILTGLELLDKDNKSVLKVGPTESYKVVTVELKENERIIGFRSSKRGSSYAYHYDFQLIIGWLV